MFIKCFSFPKQVLTLTDQGYTNLNPICFRRSNVKTLNPKRTTGNEGSDEAWLDKLGIWDAGLSLPKILDNPKLQNPEDDKP